MDGFSAMNKKLLSIFLLAGVTLSPVYSQTQSVVVAGEPIVLPGVRSLTESALEEGYVEFQNEFKSNRTKKRVATGVVATALLYMIALEIPAVAEKQAAVFDGVKSLIYSGFRLGKNVAENSVPVPAQVQETLPVDYTKLAAVAGPNAEQIGKINNVFGRALNGQDINFGPIKEVAEKTSSLSITNVGSKLFNGAWTVGGWCFETSLSAGSIIAKVGTTVAAHVLATGAGNKVGAHVADFFRGRTIDWAVDHYQLATLSKKAQMHAAALDNNSPLLNVGKMSISVYPTGDVNYSADGLNMSQEGLNKVVELNQYAQMRKHAMDKDMSERTHEVANLLDAWNNYVDGMAVVCGRLSYDIVLKKSQNLVAVKALADTQQSLIDSVNKAAETIEKCLKNLDFTGLFVTVQNCMSTCNYELEKAQSSL